MLWRRVFVWPLQGPQSRPFERVEVWDRWLVHLAGSFVSHQFANHATQNHATNVTANHSTAGWV